MAASSEPSLVVPLFIATSDVATLDSDEQFPMIQKYNEEQTEEIRFFHSVFMRSVFWAMQNGAACESGKGLHVYGSNSVRWSEVYPY